MNAKDGWTRRVSGAGWPRAVAVCVAAGACLLGTAASASASKLWVDPSGTLRFSAAQGEINHVDATDLGTGGFTVITDPGSTVHVGVGCTAVTSHQGRCPLPASQNQNVTIDLADQDDSVHAFKLSSGSIRISGGTGNDTIEDLPQSGANVSGGTGADTITVHPNFGGRVDVHGDAGNDSITALSAAGVVDGGADRDTITLTNFVDPFSGPGSAAYGGLGNDTILANGATSASLVDGGDGGDRITTDGFATVSKMVGGAGKDRITSTNVTGGGMPFLYPAEIDCGADPDIIDGGGDGDTIDCGLGVDHYAVYAGDVVTGCEIPI
jgi:Ca2+-binding RTX toxin-like protein